MTGSTLKECHNENPPAPRKAANNRSGHLKGAKVRQHTVEKPIYFSIQNIFFFQGQTYWQNVALANSTFFFLQEQMVALKNGAQQGYAKSNCPTQMAGKAPPKDAAVPREDTKLNLFVSIKTPRIYKNVFFYIPLRLYRCT